MKLEIENMSDMLEVRKEIEKLGENELYMLESAAYHARIRKEAKKMILRLIDDQKEST